MGSWEREQPIRLLSATNLQSLISPFTHEIFILLPVPATVCPAINSNSNKGKINSFQSVRLFESSAEQTAHYACASASWEKCWQPRERRKNKNPIRKIPFALYNPSLQFLNLDFFIKGKEPCTFRAVRGFPVCASKVWHNKDKYPEAGSETLSLDL